MKKIKHSLGLLYWNLIKKSKTWKYHTKRDLRSIKEWIKGWFYRWKLDPHTIKEVRDLVICAHPDDETIFFSSILKMKKPFVICMSNRGNAVRRQEFCNALSYWGVKGVMLSFPDVPTLSFIWKWRMGAALTKFKKSMPQIATVYTHSANGESGHPHHYAVSDGVRKVFPKCRILMTAVSIPENGRGRLTEDDLTEKYSVLCKCYVSQTKILEKWCPWWQAYLTTEYFEE